MTKAPSPLLGYNNNVRHKNRVFHIQTEDSGVKRPHIITHLFMDGGRILKSVKTSYADHVENDKCGDIVRQMMKDQHKAMFKALRDGAFDSVVDDAIASPRKSEPQMSAAAKPAVNPVAPTIAAPKMPRDEGPVTVRDESPLTLDLDALGTEHSGTFQPQADLPPPPANVLRGNERAAAGESGTGRYRTVEERDERPPLSHREGARARTPTAKSDRPPRTGDRKSERPISKSERPPRSAKAAERARIPTPVREERVSRRDPREEPPSEPRQLVANPSQAPAAAAARPAAIFGQARPQSSIFGEDIISDKSLDEVILSYLAEDLEDGK